MVLRSLTTGRFKVPYNRQISGVLLPADLRHLITGRVKMCCHLNMKNYCSKKLSTALKVKENKCDPPYENTSYPQKRFLGALRSL